MTLQRLGRVKHPDLGECVRVKLREWEGPTAPGERGRERWTAHLFPVRQAGRATNPRTPSGYDDSGRRTACVSPSASYHGELCRYANFRWTA